MKGVCRIDDQPGRRERDAIGNAFLGVVQADEPALAGQRPPGSGMPRQAEERQGQRTADERGKQA